MTKVFTIEVLNVKEPPVSIHFKSVGGQLNFPDDSPKVNENTALKTTVGIVEARDQEPGPLTFSLDDSAGNLFELATPATCTTTSVRTQIGSKYFQVTTKLCIYREVRFVPRRFSLPAVWITKRRTNIKSLFAQRTTLHFSKSSTSLSSSSTSTINQT